VIWITASGEKDHQNEKTIERRDVGRPASSGVFGSTLFPPDLIAIGSKGRTKGVNQNDYSHG
jgi:hypothetical protein